MPACVTEAAWQQHHVPELQQCVCVHHVYRAMRVQHLPVCTGIQAKHLLDGLFLAHIAWLCRSNYFAAVILLLCWCVVCRCSCCWSRLLLCPGCCCPSHSSSRSATKHQSARWGATFNGMLSQLWLACKELNSQADVTTLLAVLWQLPVHSALCAGNQCVALLGSSSSQLRCVGAVWLAVNSF